MELVLEVKELADQEEAETQPILELLDLELQTLEVELEALTHLEQVELEDQGL